MGAEPSRSLPSIGAVAVDLDSAQRATLASHPEVRRVWSDRLLESSRRRPGNDDDSDSGNSSNDGNDGGGNDDGGLSFWQTPPASFTDMVGADALHQQGITGSGVTIAVLDSGFVPRGGLMKNSQGQNRLLAHYDAISDRDRGFWTTDYHGHAGHITSVAINSERTDGLFNGVAPDADLVVVKAFDSEGEGTYVDVINGIEWVLANRETYGIRVLNLSFSAPAISHYWDDPLNQAVMRAWQAGIVVVASAGNRGPEPMTIGAPGNVPYVITVGAMTDSYTPDDPADDRLTVFSSSGPTRDAFIKPEVVAPGGHLPGLIQIFSRLAF